MATKEDLPDWVEAALKHQGGSARLVDIAKYIWEHHESELRVSGDLFYKRQYDMRWAANQLRRTGKMKAASFILIMENMRLLQVDAGKVAEVPMPFHQVFPLILAFSRQGRGEGREH
ncbi:hypothetical protein [Nitrosococcus wardiae]|uniref:hypothetical protein n=1 Tax=Nitrosococcus wardiae TaxID=1814290 RepID=UPI0019820EBA|nr:hypothetical protein [Nitrosococcus wardiae]